MILLRFLCLSQYYLWSIFIDVVHVTRTRGGPLNILIGSTIRPNPRFQKKSERLHRESLGTTPGQARDSPLKLSHCPAPTQSNGNHATVFRSHTLDRVPMFAVDVWTEKGRVTEGRKCRDCGTEMPPTGAPGRPRVRCGDCHPKPPPPARGFRTTSCRGCGEEFREARSGRPRKYCPKCRPSRKDILPLPDRACEHCGATFKPKAPKQTFCSKACWLERRFPNRKPLGDVRTCPECGTEHRGPRRVFCSQECASIANNRRTKAKNDALTAARPTYLRNCAVCGDRFATKYPHQKLCPSAACKKESYRRARVVWEKNNPNRHAARNERRRKRRLTDPDKEYAAQRRWAEKNRHKNREKDRKYRERLKAEDPEGFRAKRREQERRSRIARTLAKAKADISAVSRDGIEEGIVPPPPPPPKSKPVKVPFDAGTGSCTSRASP